MAILRLIKGTRDYILKSERDGYWDKRVEKLQKEIADIAGDSPELSDKQEELKELSKTAEKEKAKFSKNGPTIWKLHSINKETLKKELANSRIVIGKFKGMSKDEVTSGMIGYSSLVSLKTAKMGLDGWENLKDPNGSNVPFDRELIEQLDDWIITELANEINGAIDEEEEANLSNPSES